MQPLTGFTHDADPEASVLLVVDVHEEGSRVWPGTRLTYHVGGEELPGDSSAPGLNKGRNRRTWPVLPMAAASASAFTSR